MAQPPTRVDSFADGGGQGDTEPGAPTSPGPGRSWADVFGTTTKATTSSPPMPPMPWEDAAAAPAPSWTAPLERLLASAAASLSAATQPPPPPSKPRPPRTVDFASAPSHYTTLGVPPTASQAEIRAAYRRLALEHHPDRNTRGVDRMARVNAAYAVLDSPRARRSYDYDLRFGRVDGARRRATEAD